MPMIPTLTLTLCQIPNPNSSFTALVPWTHSQALAGWVAAALRDTPHDLPDHHTRTRAVRPYAVGPLTFPDPIRATPQGLALTTPWLVATVRAADPAWLEALAQALPSYPLQFGFATYGLVSAVITADPLPPDPWITPLQSPLVVTRRLPVAGRPGPKVYVSPADPAFGALLQQNLAKKTRLWDPTANPESFALTLPSPARWRRRFWRLYGHPVLAWQPLAPLVITGSDAVRAAAATFGLGLMTTHGFGSLPASSEDPLSPAARHPKGDRHASHRPSFGSLA